MKIDLKIITPYLIIAFSVAVSWGTLNARLDAVESKIDTVTQMQQDIAIIKEKIMWMETYLITSPDR